MKLNESDKVRISTAVAKAEHLTSGEIVPMIINSSDHYPAAHFRLALFMGFTTSIAYYYSPIEIDDSMYLILAQIPGWVLGYLLAHIGWIKRLLTTKAEMEEETRQRALQAFFEHKLHTTRDRTGILLFVSMMEKKVHLLADAGIEEKVDQNDWDKLVNVLIERIKRGQVIDGIADSINTCGKFLRHSFPIKDDDTNELPDGVITD